jgi:hypothetical protein
MAIVIVGAGVAGMRAARSDRARGAYVQRGAPRPLRMTLAPRWGSAQDEKRILPGRRMQVLFSLAPGGRIPIASREPHPSS